MKGAEEKLSTDQVAPQRPSSSLDPQRKRERFFSSIKDQIELTKGVSLGLAVIAASHPLLATSLSPLTRIVGAMICITLGFWTLYCAVALFFQHRLTLQGLRLRLKVARVAQYIVITTACLYAGNLVFEIGKQASAIRAGLAGNAAMPSNSAHHDRH